MPAFIFEKISPPAPGRPIAPIGSKPRGVIVQILDRFVELRVRRALKKEKAAIARRPEKQSE